MKLINNFGYFKPTDPCIDGIKFGNWGSRPYEYFWAASITDIKDKKVLDLGTGLPSEHNWYKFALDNLQPSHYHGIDFDSRMHNEPIDEHNCKMCWMDMSDLKIDDNSIDIIYSISTFEHIDNVETFMKCIKEANRVLKKEAVMVVTLDELWNTFNNDPIHSAWNELEKALRRDRKIYHINHSFGMKDFIELVSEYFEPVFEDDETAPQQINSQSDLLYSPLWNSKVSHGVFKVKK